MVCINDTNVTFLCKSNLNTILNIQIDIAKSIHVCFSPKKGRSDTASYPENMIILKQYGNNI